VQVATLVLMERDVCHCWGRSVAFLATWRWLRLAGSPAFVLPRVPGLRRDSRSLVSERGSPRRKRWWRIVAASLDNGQPERTALLVMTQSLRSGYLIELLLPVRPAIRSLSASRGPCAAAFGRE
jgi:hypothetical protein